MKHNQRVLGREGFK